MQFRIGIHSGDIMEKADGSIYGDGVNIAARLQALAEPGQITVSDAIHGAVRGKVSATFIDQGEQTIKNIAYPIRAYRVQIGDNPEGATASVAKPLSGEIDLSLPDKPSIAVLPFTNMSGDPEQEYFTDGITEDIITELSRFHSLFVIARNSSFTYKGKPVDVRTVSKELGVRYVLEGSIRRSANRIRVTAQLIDALSGNHIWAEKYDRVLEDIFAVQKEVTECIVAAIAPQIEAAEMNKAKRRRPSNLSAYEVAVRAWAHAMKGGAEADRALADIAIQEAHVALSIDPDSTLALMAIAWCHVWSIFHKIAADPELALREAKLATARAVELDRTNSSALAVKAISVVLTCQYSQYPDALADARRAHELNPNDTFALRMLSSLEAFGGEPEQAIVHGQQILRLDPRDPKMYAIYSIMCAAGFAARRYEDGVRWGQRAIQDNPRAPNLYTNLAICYVGTGQIAKAQAVHAGMMKLAPTYARSRIAGESLHGLAQDRERQRIFMRIAAGLEDPSAADALR